jgi:hypothetical protein
MKMTLLDMTQNILSAMDGDAVNSIADTVESLQVAETIVETYHEMYAGLDNPSMWGRFSLQSLADTNNPTWMRIPDNVKFVKWIMYNDKEIAYVEPERFLLDTMNSDGTLFNGYRVKTDRDPTLWTSFDNNIVIFNAIDFNADGTLQESKSTCWGQFVPQFQLLDDAYAPFISPDDYPGLLAEAKSTCFINYKNTGNSKEEQKARRQRVRRQSDQWRLNQRKPYDRANFGRPTRANFRGNGRIFTSTP